MDKKLTSEESLIQEIRGLEKRGLLSPKFCQLAIGFMQDYRVALESCGEPFIPYIPIFRLFFDLVFEQLRSPHPFTPYNKKIRHPIDYHKFSLDFIRPLIDLAHSTVVGTETLNTIEEQLRRGENAVFLANHQTEPDPQVIAIMLEKTHPKLSEEIIYVAGERVITDPLAVPFSLGCDLLCIYSKRYIDRPPELKTQKQHHNKSTMELMSRLLSAGGKAIYVAPSGGRDRKDGRGQVPVAPFDPQSVEMFYLMAKKAKTPTHFYPLALSTYDLLPPPEIIQVELGEQRVAKRTAVHLAFGPECDLENAVKEKEERRKLRAERVWTKVVEMYTRMQR
jgi:glycerol-3-phosphate O-acyltransferase